MHPLVGNWRRLLWYMVAWLPVVFLLDALLRSAARLGAPQAAFLAPALTVCFGFGCLPVWYICRALPLHGDLAQSLGVQLATAGVVGLMYALFAHIWAANSGWTADLQALYLVVGGTGATFYLLVAAGFYLVLSAERVGEAERRALRVAVMANQAELRALKAQINPHFLFNSLNSISALTASNPERAREMTVRLADFLRRTLALGTLAEHSTVALAQELDLVRAFLAIEQVRFGDRLRLEEAIEPAALDARLPPLLLQPLVENAVVHGIAHLTEGGVIRMEARCSERVCRLAVANPYDPEAVLAPRAQRGGLGLANVEQRLLAHFGGRGRCEVARAAGRFEVRLTVPLEQTA